MTEEERPTFTPAPEEAPPSEADEYEIPEDAEPTADEDDEPDEELD